MIHSPPKRYFKRKPYIRGSAAPIEGEASDFTGTTMLVHTLSSAKALLADRGYDADWVRKALAEGAASPPASPQRPIVRSTSRTIGPSIISAIASRTCSPALKTGDASTPDTIAAL